MNPNCSGVSNSSTSFSPSGTRNVSSGKPAKVKQLYKHNTLDHPFWNLISTLTQNNSYLNTIVTFCMYINEENAISANQWVDSYIPRTWCCFCSCRLSSVNCWRPYSGCILRSLGLDGWLNGLHSLISTAQRFNITPSLHTSRGILPWIAIVDANFILPILNK